MMNPEWSGAIARSVATQAIHKYFTTQNIPLTKHHIDSYDQFIQRDMQSIIAAENPIINVKEPLGKPEDGYKYKAEIYVGGLDGKAIRVGVPTVRLNDGEDVRILFPNEARLRNLTYSLPVQVDIFYRVTIKSQAKAVPIVHEETIHNFPLAQIPLMLHSRYCPLHDKPQSALVAMGECPEDSGGYFIIDGSEKVLVTRQEQAFNTLYISEQKRDPNTQYYTTIQSLNPRTRLLSRTSINWTRERTKYVMREQEYVYFPSVMEVKLPQVTKPVPLFIVFRALGIQTDRDIMNTIFPDMESPEAKMLMELLTSSMHAAQPILTTYDALTYIQQFTKGASLVRVYDILINEFFCHIDFQEDKRDFTPKISFLAHCVRSILRVVKKLDPTTNKDDTRNQRLITSGFSIQKLFQGIYGSWLEAFSRRINEEYNYHKQQYSGENFKDLFGAGMVGFIFRQGFIDEGIMRAFKGKWGSGKGGDDDEAGVVQALARISYLDFMSHCRRVVSDFDTSLKLTGPRQLHTSQYGYFCTSETPSGGHIGVTKNLSIFTAISNGMIPNKLVQWLYGRAGVIAPKNATPALIRQMVPIFLNNSIIGYTERPEELASVLRCMKRTGCLPPYSSNGFNRRTKMIFIYTDEGRPLRPLFTAPLPDPRCIPAATSWRDIVCGNLPQTVDVNLQSIDFIDIYADQPEKTLIDYITALTPHMGVVEYIDPYEQNESYIANVPEHIREGETTHMEVHASSILGLLGCMIPFANHNQSPRNQLSASQSKQSLSMYATNFQNRYDNNAHILCYPEMPLSRTVYQDYIGSGRMGYGHNLVLALAIHSGYNQEDGIVINKSALERGMFRNISYRTYEGFEEDDPLAGTKTRIANPYNTPAWLDVRIGYDYSKLDPNGIVKPGSYVDENTVILGRHMMLPNGEFRDASVTPQVWTSGRVDEVITMVGPNGLRIVKIRVVQDRTPELGDKFCLTSDHDVLTSDGWIPITQLNHSYSVASWNPTTFTIGYETPEMIMGFQHTGLIYDVKTEHGMLSVTAEHKLYVSDSEDRTWRLKITSDVFQDVASGYVRYMMSAGDKNPVRITCIQKHQNNPYSESVHCIQVQHGVFVARKHGSTIGFLTGNSNRHGQKGTIGMMVRGMDMPRTVDGIVPDMIMNPHAIPSRMTIAQLLEQLFGKLAAESGALVNATTFMNEGSPHEVVGDALEELGLERYGNQILYDGMSGKMIEAAIFIGPVYNMRLKHMTEDKWNARGAGRKEQRTHQPTGGRGAQGGLKIGEMERDAIVAHGAAAFTRESMMERSDKAEFIVCNGCGTVPIYNERQDLYICSLCDGPIQYTGSSPDTLEPIVPSKRSSVSFSRVEMPYATKLFFQEMEVFMNMGMRLLTTHDVERLPAVEDVEELTEEAAAGLETELPLRTYAEVETVTPYQPTAALPTIEEIRENVAQLQEEQKAAVAAEREARNRREAVEAQIIGVNSEASAPSAPSAPLNTTTVGFTNTTPPQPQAIGPQTNIPIVNNPSLVPTVNAAITVASTAEEFPSTTAPPSIMPNLAVPQPGLDIVPGSSTGGPTFVVDTSETAQSLEGLPIFSPETAPRGTMLAPAATPIQAPMELTATAPRRSRGPRPPPAYSSYQTTPPVQTLPPQESQQIGGSNDDSYSGASGGSGGDFKVIKLA